MLSVKGETAGEAEVEQADKRKGKRISLQFFT
jgi:hypothetical protein